MQDAPARCKKQSVLGRTWTARHFEVPPAKAGLGLREGSTQHSASLRAGLRLFRPATLRLAQNQRDPELRVAGLGSYGVPTASGTESSIDLWQLRVRTPAGQSGFGEQLYPRTSPGLEDIALQPNSWIGSLLLGAGSAAEDDGAQPAEVTTIVVAQAVEDVG
jgi:hypothetical protein